MIFATEGERLALAEAIPRHMRGDGTVNFTTLGAEIGLHRSNARRRVIELASAGALGFSPVLPGYSITRTSTEVIDENGGRTWVRQDREGSSWEMPEGHAVKGVSALLNAHGDVVAKWIKTRADGEPTIEDTIEALKGAFADVQPASPTPRAERSYTNALTLYPVPDMHLGLHVWGEENGGEDWDLKIAEASISAAFDELVAMTPASQTAVILGGGDQFHADNGQNRTPNSGNHLDVDGRYQKVIGTGCRLWAGLVCRALARHAHVVVRILPGNHDEHASVALAYYLSAYFRLDPRVTVSLDPSLFWWQRWGRTFLGATHGHLAKPKDMPLIMATRRPEDWGKSEHRYCHTFHVHHATKEVSEGGGVITETHQAPVPQDSWHFGKGFLSGRSLQSIVYDDRDGEIGRSRVGIRKRGSE